MSTPVSLRSIVGLLFLAAATPVLAQPYGGWGPGYGGYGSYGSYDRGPDIPVGKVTVARFVANDPRVAQLGHGPISVTPGMGDTSDLGERAAFEAAIVDQLAANGYSVNAPGGTGQVAEMVIEHRLVAPPEQKRNPVSGGVSVGGGSYGSFGGLGIAIDLSKPRKAVVGTRLQVRIRDAGGDKAVLWEGRAEIATYEGDKKWTSDAIARKLTTTLFKGFPTAK